MATTGSASRQCVRDLAGDLTRIAADLCRSAVRIVGNGPGVGSLNSVPGGPALAVRGAAVEPFLPRAGPSFHSVAGDRLRLNLARAGRPETCEEVVLRPRTRAREAA